MIDKDISFIIPALNEEAHINGVLASIRENLEGCYQYEVILIDNGSSDRTVEIAKKNGAICFDSPGSTISSMRNRGAAEASSDIFVFLDADVYLGKDWGGRIGAVLERLHRQPQILTGSIYGISSENNWIEKAWFAPRTTMKETNYINGGHLIIHRSLFAEVGGFDCELETGEDYEFCVRARRMGALIENDPELKVVHAGYPKDLKRFFLRERWHARGDYKSLKALGSSKPALVSLANLCMAGTCTFGIVISQSWLVFSAAYLFLLAGVSLAASIHRGRGNYHPGFWCTVLLYMVYFTARTVSIVDVVIQGLIKKSPRRLSTSA